MIMWANQDEPLYEERILGERVRFIWRQTGQDHFICAQWVRGENPWEVETCEAQDNVRHVAIAKATQAMREKIAHIKK